MVKLDIFNINDFITANNCKEVTNPVFFDYSGQPTPDGLFSYDIFGYTDDERKNTFAYIDLHGHFVHPLVYLIMIKKMGSLGKVITGQKYAVIRDKKIEIVNQDFNGAETGIQFLYDNYEQINWIDELEESTIDSLDKKTRLKFIQNLKKDEFFVDKWLVLPPFYRAESSMNRSMGDAINKLYKELISKVKGLSMGFSFSIFGAETEVRIQNLLKDIYLATTAPISGKNLMIEKGKQEATLAGSGKNSMIRRHMLGKTVDWSASSVITSPTNSNADTLKDKPVPFGYGAFPLATLLSLFQPFYVSYCSDFFESYLAQFYTDNVNNIKKINLNQYGPTEIEKLIKRYIKDLNNRTAPLSFKFINKDGQEDEMGIAIYEFKNENDAKNNINFVKRPFTLLDLLYIASEDVLKGKHVYVTRFPVANFQNIYPARVKVLTTAKTSKKYIKLGNLGDEYVEFDEYPTIRYNNNISKIDSDFYDVMLCGNAVLDTLGGDYDGDMLYMRAVFSQEANAEADKLIWAKTNMLNAEGMVARGLSKIGKGCIIGLYELTKDGPTA